jgi:hypothetical protein
VQSDLPTGVDTSWFFQIYRTKEATITVGSGDEMFLIYESQVSSTDVTNGYIQVTDITDDTLVGASLYTNETQEGEFQANTQPPACVDLTSYQNHMFYANTKQRDFFNVTLIGEMTTGDEITFNVSGGGDQTLTGDTHFVIATGGTTA